MGTSTRSSRLYSRFRNATHAGSSSIRRCALVIAGLAILGATGCKSYDVVPNDLEPHLATGLTYEMVRDAPTGHQGKLVAWGGEVLAGKRTREGTRLEILHLPLTDDLYPTEERARSKGRFVVYDTEGTITDPAVVEPGTAVTIIGRIGPLQTEELQGVKYQYPRVDVLDMTVWEKKLMRNWRHLGSRAWQYDPRPRTLYRSYRID